MTHRRADSSRAPKHRAVRRRRSLPVSAAIGGSALMLAAVGAVSLSQPLPQAGAQPAAASQVAGSQVAGTGANPTSTEPRDSLYSRSVLEVSRGGSRTSTSSTSTSTSTLESAAEAQAAERKAQLETAAVRARSYAEDLTSQLWVLPTTGFHISTWFGEPGYYWSSGYHTGIDFATACGTAIVAVTGGTVDRAGWDGPYGYQVRETLPNGDQVWYNHMTVIKTPQGAQLDKGEVVGLVGETGNAYGCHVHFEYRLASDLENAVDPEPFFTAHGINLR